MLSRLRLAGRLGTGTAQLLQAAKPSIPAATRLCQSQVQEKKDATPEFGQFWREVSAKLKAKTGETGHLLLLGGLGAYVLSKELLVIHEETYIAAVMAGTFIYVMKKTGKPIAEALDNMAKDILDTFNAGRNKHIESLETAIVNEKNLENMLSCRKDIAELLRENNVMNMELGYRKSIHHVLEEVKKRLDYQAEIESFQRRVEQDHITDWVENEVIKSISHQQEKESITQCIKDLKTISSPA